MLKIFCLRRRLQRGPLTSRGGPMGARAASSLASLDRSLRERELDIYRTSASPTYDIYLYRLRRPIPNPTASSRTSEWRLQF